MADSEHSGKDSSRKEPAALPAEGEPELRRESPAGQGFDESFPGMEESALSAASPPTPARGDTEGDVERSQRETLLVSHPSLPVEPSARSLSDGLLLAERFRIVRFLGEGGMGEVYEAEDLELRERVALKTVRPEIAAQPRAMDEFRREVHLARKVTHPNVCRIFDVFHHRESGRKAVTFVTMELLPGETLARRLRREGRMQPENVLPITRQMAAALAAAHARGVVHRDFKGANVMLVPSADAEGGVRAVVTDFGLARGEAGGDDSFGTLHTAGRIAGTPAYMAPEQVSGGPVTPAIDVYALGIVLYEMLTGRPPFLADSPLVTAMMRLKEAPTPPSTLVPELDRQWERVILRCLEREPEARYARAGDVAAALDGQSVQSARLPARAAVGRRPWLAAAALALVALGAGAAWLWRAARGAPSDATGGVTATVPSRPSLAVLGFKNLAGREEQAWLSTAFSEMLASELAAGGHLRLLPGESVARAKLELALDDTAAFAQDTLERLRRNLGSDLVVSGSYLASGDKAGGRLRLDVRVQDARSGEALDPVVANGTEAELAEMVSRCGRDLRAALGVRDVEDRELAAARAAFSSNPAWARLYAEGLERLRHYDAPGARDRLEQATAADPRQPMAHSALAQAWDQLGYGAKARAAAQRALDLAGDLSREERLLVEARSRAMSFDWTAAVENYRALFGFFPDNLDYGLGLADALKRADRAEEAAAVVAALRRLPSPARDDARIDLAEARVAEARSDYPRAAELAEQAAAKGSASGASLVVAEARLHHAWSLFRMGEAEAVKLRASEAQRLYDGAGDRSGAAAALMIQAHVLWIQQGRHDEAGRMYAQALAAFRAAGNQRDVASALLNSAGALQAQGDLDGSRRRSEEALQAFREIGDRESEASALTNLGNLHLQLGQPGQAQERQAEAVKLFRDIGSRSGEAHALGGLGDAQRAAGALDEARASFEQALAQYQATSEKTAAAWSRVQLAQLQVDAGRYAEAVPAARAAAEELRQAGHTEGEAMALEALAQAQLGQGQVAQARETVRSAGERAAQETRGTRVKIAITAARVEDRDGRREAALARLREALADARASGRVDLELEARLALAELGAEPRAALAREARRRGFGLIARQAEN